MFFKKLCITKQELLHSDEFARINFTLNKITIRLFALIIWKLIA